MNRSVFNLHQLSKSLTDEDLHVLSSLHSHRLLTTSQLQRLWFGGGKDEDSNARLARLRLSKLEGRGLTCRLARRIGGVRAGSSGQVWQLTALGSRLAIMLAGEEPARGREPSEPGEQFVRHTIECGEVFVRLTETARAARFELLEYQSEPGCWREFTGAFGQACWLKPDGFVQIGIGAFEERAFVEVDLSTHGRAAIRRKLGIYDAFLSSGHQDAFSRVLWLVIDVQRRDWLRALIGELPPERAAVHQVELLDDLVPALLREERGGRS